MRTQCRHTRLGRCLVPFALLFAESVCASATSTTVSLTVAPNPALYGMPVSFTATVSPATATGTITFYNGVGVLGIAALSSGSATLSTTLLPVGRLSLQARYSGDSSNAASLSPVFVETVNALGGNGFASSGSWATVGPADPLDPDFIVLFRASPPAIADFNSDGQPDLAVVNSGAFFNQLGTNSVSVLLGDGNGGFSVRAPIPIVGTGGFTPINIPVAGATNVFAAADFNGDGNLDLAFASPGDFTASLVTVWLGNGQGGFPVQLDNRSLNN